MGKANPEGPPARMKPTVKAIRSCDRRKSLDLVAANQREDIDRGPVDFLGNLPHDIAACFGLS